MTREEIERLRRLSVAARAEVAKGEPYGNARAAFLSEMEDSVLHNLIEIAYRYG